MLPDKKRFGIFWLNQRELESAFDMSGAFNSVTLKLAYGAKSQAVIDRASTICWSLTAALVRLIEPISCHISM